MTPRVAVLGCGSWGKMHIHNLRELGALYAVCDRDTEKAKKIAEHYAVDCVHSDDIFLRKDIDAIILALPPQFHAQNAICALENKKDVLVEKPMALVIEDAEQEIKAANDNSRILMVGHLLRFHPAFEKLVDLVRTGLLGKIRFIRSQRLGIGRFHTKCDALWDLAPHDLSMIFALTGCNPSQIKKEDIQVVNNFADFSCLHLLFPNGLRSHVTVSRLNPYRERRLTVIGSKAIAVFDDLQTWGKKLSLYHFTFQQSSRWKSFVNEPEYIPIIEDLPLRRELKHFLHCIETREEAKVNGDEGICVLRALTLANSDIFSKN